MSEITLKQLEDYLWQSAVILRGSMGAGSYKNYVFPLMFYKRICDVYDEEYSEALEVSEGDVEYASMDEVHRFIIPQSCHWNVVRSTSTEVGSAISKALKGIEAVNPRLSGIFGDAVWTNKNRLPDRLLKDLIEHLSTLTLSNKNCPADEFGTAYEYLVGKFADDSGHTAQEFYTNRTVVHLMTELLRPQQGERIYDPTCGSGGMLISSVAYLRDHGQEWRSLKLYGQEINPLTCAIARMNMFLHGIEDFEIIQGDTLENPYFIEGDQLKTFDLVLANPPYSIKQWDHAKFTSDPYGRNYLGNPPKGKADYAFFQHILKSMNPKTGRCAILFPHGVLFRRDESELRGRLIESDSLECIIGVADNLFFNSPMEACIVICNNNKPSYLKDRIKFIDAKTEYVKDGKHNSLSKDNIARIKSVFDATEDIPGVMSIRDNQDILENGSNLSISINVEQVKKEESINIESVVGQWKQSFSEYSSLYEELLLSSKSEKGGQE